MWSWSILICVPCVWSALPRSTITTVWSPVYQCFDTPYTTLFLTRPTTLHGPCLSVFESEESLRPRLIRSDSADSSGCLFSDVSSPFPSDPNKTNGNKINRRLRIFRKSETDRNRGRKTEQRFWKEKSRNSSGHLWKPFGFKFDLVLTLKKLRLLEVPPIFLSRLAQVFVY